MRPGAPRRPRLAAAGALLAAGTAALSSTGVLHGLDQYAVDHAMPWLVPRERPLVTIGGLLFPHLHGPAVQALLGLLTYPAAFAPSLVLILAATWRLGSRTRLTWAASWVAGNAIEAAGKLGLDRPSLFKHGVHASTFDDSLPSGHTIRAILVAAAVASARRHGRPAFAWAAVVPPALVVTGAHTVTDVIAGTGVALAVLAWAPRRRIPEMG